MAKIIPFTSKQGKGFMLANLPLPDGSYKTYRLIRQGRQTFRILLDRWKNDCEAILSKIVWN